MIPRNQTPAKAGEAATREDVSALVLGAGLGLRLGMGPKAFVSLAATETLVERAVAMVAPFAAEILVGVPPQDERRARALLELLPWPSTVLAGGQTRQQTVSLLLARASRPMILLHEVARPMVAAELFQAVLAGAAQTGAASLYVPLDIHDALATTAPDGSIESILPRSRVVRLQTPHAYRREVLADAHRRAEQAGIKEDGTAAIVKWAGYGVQLISGSAENIKITYPPDLEAAAAPSLRP